MSTTAISPTNINLLQQLSLLSQLKLQKQNATQPSKSSFPFSIKSLGLDKTSNVVTSDLQASNSDDLIDIE